MTMNSFPWDSLVVEMGEDGFPVYDRAWSADDLAEVFEPFFSNGVFMNDDEALAVTAGTSLVLTVGFGKCHIGGRFGYIRQEREYVTIEAPDSQPRIDTIAIRRNRNLQSRDFKPVVIKGTPSANPVRPNLTRTGTIYDLGISDVLVRPGATSISQADIMDTRLEPSRCGMVAPFVELDTESLMLRMSAALDAAIAKVEQQADYSMKKLDDEIDRVIYISDQLTGGTGEGCGCYQELQQVKDLLYELLGKQDDAKYYVIGKTLYPPSGSMTIDGKTAKFNDTTISGKTVHINIGG